MAILTEWDVDFTSKVISHIDGTMAWQSAAGDPPDAGDYIKGGTSSATGKLLDSTVDYSTATGTAKIANVNGTFVDTETLTGLAFVTFDTASNGGFSVGDTIQNSGGTIVFDVDAIEYNTANDGTGTMWGVETTGQVINTTSLRLSTATSVEVCVGTATTTVATAWTTAVVNSANGLVPATITRIVNYDTGTIAIPRFARVDDGVGGASGQVQNVVGVTATGSIRVVDIPAGQAFVDGETIRLLDNIYYDGQVGGQKFRVNDTVVGAAGATGKILAINETVPGTSGDFTLLNLVGTFVNNENISVGGTVIALVEAAAGDPAAFVKDVAVVNGAELTEQLSAQGGIYTSAASSLNGVRDLNSLYTYLQDTFDELGALDDLVPMTAQVKLQQYTLINGWIIPDSSFKFLQSGSVQDSALANIWTNYTTIGSVAGITDTGYLPTSTPIPQIYIEQDGTVIDTFWLQGHINVLVKVTSNSTTTLAVGAAPDFTDGLTINNGTVTIFSRRYGDTYDHFETTTIAGVAPIPVATAADINNTTGTHSFDCNVTTGYAVGEEFVDNTDATKRGVVTALDTGPTGLTYIFTGTTQFANADVVVNQVSTSLATLSSTITSEVAAYGMADGGASGKIVVATVNGTLAHGAITSGPFVEGELITQAVTGAQAIMMDDTSTVWTLGNQKLSAAAILEFDATNLVTGVTSGANCTPSATTHTSLSTIDRDIDDGNGNQPFNSVIYMNSQNDGGDTLARMYEWIKYRTRGLTVGGVGETTGEEAYDLLGSPGLNESGFQGRVYITLDSTYPLSKASPFGTFAGGTFFGATGVFIQDMAAADIRNYQLIDNNSVLRSPPNLQALTAAGLVSGDRVAVFRRPNVTAGSGINTTEYTLDSAASTFNLSASNFIRVQAAIGTDTPATGVVRVFDADTGNFLSYNYDSFTGQEFDVSTTPLTLALTVSSDTFVPLIERQAAGSSESVNLKYQADIPLLARVRKKGILPFEVEGTFGSAGATVTAIRTTDTIVD
jgi:hypothetical protein